MPETIVIEPATIADVDGIHRVEQESFPSPWRREFFEFELGGSGRFNLVARAEGGTIVAYLLTMWLFDEMHINKIAVRESHRRQGIADALMARCFEFARRHNVATISLEVRRTNRGAQDFYRRLQFEPTFIRQRYYPDGEDAVVMMLQLANSQ